jgi:hypothetical protein
MGRSSTRPFAACRRCGSWHSQPWLLCQITRARRPRCLLSCAMGSACSPLGLPAGRQPVILLVIPPRRTSKTRSNQMDVITDLTCKDGTAHHVVDGGEATHNSLAPDSTRWTRGCSSVGQSRRLITAGSQVRGLPAPPARQTSLARDADELAALVILLVIPPRATAQWQHRQLYWAVLAVAATATPGSAAWSARTRPAPRRSACPGRPVDVAAR